MKGLFVIDMQEEYVGQNNRYGYDSLTLIKQVNERIQQAEANQEIIIYIKNRKKLKSGIQTPEFAQQLHVISQHIFLKEHSSLFSNKDVIPFLKTHGVTEIEMVGVDGNCCVASSAIEGVKLGLTVSISCKYIGVKNVSRFCKRKIELIESGVIVAE